MARRPNVKTSNLENPAKLAPRLFLTSGGGICGLAGRAPLALSREMMVGLSCVNPTPFYRNNEHDNLQNVTVVWRTEEGIMDRRANSVM